MRFIFNPNAKELTPRKANITTAESATWSTTGRTGVSALAGTAAPNQLKPRRVPGYETESRICTGKETT